jgi:hypothetical protein
VDFDGWDPRWSADNLDWNLDNGLDWTGLDWTLDSGQLRADGWNFKLWGPCGVRRQDSAADCRAE